MQVVGAPTPGRRAVCVAPDVEYLPGLNIVHIPAGVDDGARAAAAIELQTPACVAISIEECGARKGRAGAGTLDVDQLDLAIGSVVLHHEPGHVVRREGQLTPFEPPI